MASKQLVADLHLHSRYALATSPRLNIETLAETAIVKGIDLLAAPDFTHPDWREEMRSDLEPAGDGVFRRATRGETAGKDASEPLFVLVTEISCIWKQSGKSRRVHVLLMAPSFDVADRISEKLSNYQDLAADGRPMIGLSTHDLYSLALEVDARCVLFPAHAWTPWYGVYGSKSGFDSLEESFGDLAHLVPAIETGLSSTPEMNWTVPDIGDRALVSFSDAHSPATMGRELTVFEAEPKYESIASALFENRVVETIEFHPEHGKYHSNGHRNCDIRLSPEETPADGRCKACGRPLTLGVLQRVNELSNGSAIKTFLKDGLVHTERSVQGRRAPFRQLVPLRELISQAIGSGVNTKRVAAIYDGLTSGLGTELNVLIRASHDEMGGIADERVVSAIVAVRSGEVEVDPGFDGVYGTVKPRIQGSLV